MSIRVLLIFLFIIALTVIGVFLGLSLQLFWTTYGSALPSTITFDFGTVPTYTLLQQGLYLLFLFIVLVFAILLLLLDRLIVRPVKVIAQAIDAFAEHSSQMALPAFSRATSETRALADAFVKFTDNVEQLHQKDMDISRVKSDFISTAAHQLRTPLTGIRWALEALQNEALDEGQKALVKNAVDKSHDLVAIVGTLLDISSIESGKYKYTFTETDIDAMLSQIAKDFSVLAQKNNVALFYERAAVVLPHVRADQDRIKWLLNNLVENAIRYTPPTGSVRLNVELSVGKLYIRVRDTGIGIPEKDRNNIFERFFRAGNAIAKENQGNGLGLYIARQIAVDHGGDLYFEGNKDSTGTTFILVLPLIK